MGIVRVGNTVRRPTGAWTPAVHDLLAHLQRKEFDGAPRVLGVDEQGREVLTFLPGDVVYPDHLYLLTSADALAAIAGLIREFHDATRDFEITDSYQWSDRGSDPQGGDLLCHNDLAPWNLIHDRGRWSFIDWDLAAPGRRSWDLAWALLTLVPLMPGSDPGEDRILERIDVFRRTYGAGDMGADVIDVAVERCAREAHLIRTLGVRGEPPYNQLLSEGHDKIWAAARDHVSAHGERWKKAFP